ncbi:MAG TPA: MBOAT family protein [Verrucomicrobiales bacterium]|nr:MBOAT family protein [Verrucomicrobiales bacterium]HIL70835.1 MBOAT family protein [Verrucomicrobiota bacterium]
MLFNSTVFLQFFLAFMLLYWSARNHRTARNLLILAGSYFFYGWWDSRLLSLIIFSSLLDFHVGRKLSEETCSKKRKIWLTVSMTGNISVLCFFKYFGFFIDSLKTALDPLSLSLSIPSMDIILPVGISFYTFQTMSYTLDIYRRQLKPTENWVQFMAYVAFFPQLVAGPIERARRLLPQFDRELSITRTDWNEGTWLILWGMFKKVVVADNLAPLVEMSFSHPDPTCITTVAGVFAFSLQIYGDFSGYSDIARGLARLLGFKIMLNFNLPYFACNLREFWNRWHISLSTWLRDYLYISLGGNRGTRFMTCRNLMITMLLGGLWHGAAWGFIIWGAWHGCGLIALRIFGQRFKNRLPLPRPLSWLLTMSFIGYGWLLFRSENLVMIMKLSRSLLVVGAPEWIGQYLINLIFFTLPLLLFQWIQWKRNNLMWPMNLRFSRRIALQGILLAAIILYWEKADQPFIYFQF